MAEQRRKPAAQAPPSPRCRPRAPRTATRPSGSWAGSWRSGCPSSASSRPIAVGFAASVGSALLVLASGALLGTIALLWASVRTLSGDAPLPVDLEALAAQRRDVDALGEQKRRVLRALKDLEGERALGKIDEADYEAIATQYREEAKALMREMDRERGARPRGGRAHRARVPGRARAGPEEHEGSLARQDAAPRPASASARPRAPVARRRTSPTPRSARSAAPR